ncbi:MAG: ABC transporter ATP-binding protein [Corynebacterium sp.]|uniref:ABC transporter ATP-binding protein n=1 Tax=Corynebacterium sp. TaxID=1720 RepID=UPI0026DD3EF0|nr:ABC transporter ATP-binding protein [Corynebacterium sp.]MDO5029091.1 ABC transporter ATP-binding protein [Corynebacterium sp.]
MNAASSPALRLENVTKRFGDVEAVSGLSLSLDRGRVLALLGPNGAGKTTTVEMCEGFIKPDSGQIRILGLDPVTQTTALRSRIGIMLQGGGAYPGVRVGEMLDLVASYSANPLDTDWLLQVVGLERHRKTNYRRLSGGQQQRLSLACALVGRPELVFLDEPTAGLDAQSRLAVWDLISSLRRDGVTVVLTTHLMDEAESLADDVAIIDRGNLVVAGTTEEITSTGASALQGAAAASSLKLTIRGGVSTDAVNRAFKQENLPHQLRRVGGEDYSLIGEPSPRALTVLAESCETQDALITSLSKATRSLEEVFLQITGTEMRS